MNEDRNHNQRPMNTDDRIGSVEVELRWIKMSMERSQVTLEKLAEDMHKLTTLQIQQIEDRKVLERVLTQQEKLAEKVEHAFRVMETLKDSIVKRQNDERGKLIHQATATILTVITTLASAYLLHKLGWAAL